MTSAARFCAELMSAAEGLDGELIQEAVIPDREMSYMNFARSEFDSLEHLVRQLIIPALGSDQHPAAKDIYRHLEQVRTFSSNFCWKHRALGAAFDAREVRHA
ncbi:hypothetical protein D3C78_382260 [compost metagenome]